MRACIHTPRNRVRPSPDVEVCADHSNDEDSGKVCASLCSFCMYAYSTPHDRTGPYIGHLLALFITCTSASRVKNTPLSALTLQVFHPPAQQKLGSRPTRRHFRHVVFCSPLPPPPRRSAYRSKVHTSQFMAHVLVPSLQPGARRSDYAPVKQRPRGRGRRTVKGKTRTGDNSGWNGLMHVLQNAFESNWYGPGSTIRF